MPSAKLPPVVFCDRCGRQMSRLASQPIPADFQVPWERLHYHEARALAGMMLHHGDDVYREWGLLDMARAARTRYRAVNNAVRRLVPCGWLQKVRRGVYRLTPMAVETIRPKLTPRMTVEKLVPRAPGRTYGARARALLEEPE